MKNCCWKFQLATYLTISGAIITLSGSYALAQSKIVPDSTLGNESSTATPLNPDSPIDGIRGGAIRGTNWFHSFLEFNVGEGREAYFLSPNANIQNILVRVTGGKASEILGILGTRGGASPNLFLINPNGIIFGPNSLLDVGGSFVASTASSLKFSNKTDFSATEPQTPPLLTVSVPIGLQFGEGVGRIVNQSYDGLRVLPGRTLALVGGDVALEGGYLIAESGRIELGSVARSSLVSLTPISSGWTLGYEGVQNFKDILLSQEALVNAGAERGGDIQVQGKSVILTEGSSIQSYGYSSGGSLTVNATDSLELMGFVPRGNGFSNSSLQNNTFGAGTTGELRINTRKLIVQDGAVVSTSTAMGTGKGGELQVNASDSVNLSGVDPRGFSSGLFAITNGEGQGGNITVNTNTLRLADGAVVSARTTDAGNSGNITVNANTLETVRGGQVLTATRSSGKAGDINLNVYNSVTLSGSDPTFAERLARLGSDINNEGAISGLLANTAEGSTGNGGSVIIKTGQLNITDGAEVAVSSKGTGDAGNLQVQTDSIRLDNGGKLTATSTSGEGGNIGLSNLNLLLLRGNSEISTDATSGTGNGGNININTDLLAASENSYITARAIQGKGGNIRITTQGVFVSPDSSISAASERGINGVVEIRRLDVDPGADLVILPEQVVDISSLIVQGCPAGGANLASGKSSFTVAGRGGLPATPAEATRSDTPLADLGTSAQSSENLTSANIPNNPIPADSAPPLVEANAWAIGSRGEVILTASSPSVTPDIPWLKATSCHSS